MTSSASPEHEAEATGYETVQSTISCMLTRFELKSTWSIVRFYRLFRAIRKQSASVPGLLKTAFLIENARTCYTLSLWLDADALYRFNTHVDSHVAAANSCFRHLQTRHSGVQLWSAQFRLSAISPYNMRWGTFNIHEFLRSSARTEGVHADVA